MDLYLSVAMKDQQTFDKVIQKLEDETSDGFSAIANSLKCTRENLNNQ
jgi:hypothetical protein